MPYRTAASMPTATYIKAVIPPAPNELWTVKQKLYKLEPPMDGAEYVVVSAADLPMCGPETYIFPSTTNGDITNYGELSGSQKGTLDHEKVLKDAGYTVVSKVTQSSSVSTINDYVCPGCKNDKCSKSEVKCWKCGGLL